MIIVDVMVARTVLVRSRPITSVAYSFLVVGPLSVVSRFLLITPVRIK